MTRRDDTVLVRVTHRFDASAERVYDAFLDPARAKKFLFATGTGRIVRCEIDARVGGKFVIVDRRHGEDAVHTGVYLELDRPRRIVFTFSVGEASTAADKVTIDVAPLPKGCELTLTHELDPRYANFADRARDGWTGILDVAAKLLVDDSPTCGAGLVQYASIAASISAMFGGLAETLELHRTLLVLDDPNAHAEGEVYRQLAASWKEIAMLVDKASAHMAAQRDLPMGAHNEAAWGDEHLRAFERFVHAQSRTLGLLRVAAECDEEMLAEMTKAHTGSAGGP